jgi:hypothetical protein
MSWSILLELIAPEVALAISTNTTPTNAAEDDIGRPFGGSRRTVAREKQDKAGATTT